MTTETLNEYDFKSVYEYMSELTKHIAEKSDYDVNVVVLVTGKLPIRRLGQMAVITSQGENLKGYLIQALMSVYNDEENMSKADTDINDILKKIMKS